MQKKTVIKLLTVLKANYRYTYRDMTKEELALMTESWCSCLKDISDEQGEKAFRAALCKMNVPPTVADILGIVSRIQRLNEPSDAELWSILMRGVDAVEELFKGYDGDNFRKDVEELYCGLPEIVRKFTDVDTFCSYLSFDDKAKQIERTRFLKELPFLREALRDEQILQTQQIDVTERKQLTGEEE